MSQFPTTAEIEKADVEQLAKWYRFLLPQTAEQNKLMDRISERLKKAGGMTPALSKKIGYGGV